MNFVSSNWREIYNMPTYNVATNLTRQLPLQNG